VRDSSPFNALQLQVDVKAVNVSVQFYLCQRLPCQHHLCSRQGAQFLTQNAQEYRKLHVDFQKKVWGATPDFRSGKEPLLPQLPHPRPRFAYSQYYRCHQAI